jgi:predicted tellurium resistance membrane protein TerC
MSLDNVLAIAAAAHGSQFLIVIGLAISIPIVILSSTLIVTILNKAPLLIWAGAGFLGWIAGEMLVADEAAMAYAPVNPPEWLIPSVCTVLVLAVGWIVTRRHADAKSEAEAPAEDAATK